MSKDMYAVILAGGSGSRLWPMSRELYPKQLLKLNQENSLFASTFLRLIDNFDDKNTCILRIALTEGILFSEGKRLELKFGENENENT